MQALEDACTCPPIDWAGEHWKHRPDRPCVACEEWQRAHNVLHDELGLKPWEWPAVEHPESVCPYPAGSPAAAQWQRDERGVALYRELEEAAA